MKIFWSKETEYVDRVLKYYITKMTLHVKGASDFTGVYFTLYVLFRFWLFVNIIV